MRRRLAICIAALLALGSAASCEVPFTARWPGRPDAAEPADTAVPFPDAGEPPDAEVPSDAGEPPDAQERPDASWSRRQKLTFHNSAQSEELTDFPVLVVLDLASYQTGDFAAEGRDIQFRSADGTPLAHEVESFGATEAFLWVKVPRIGPTDTDFVWLYYRNPGTSVPQDPPAVWSNGFVGVWHFQTDPSGTGAIRDSTASSAHGTAANMTEANRMPSPVGTGLSFDGTSQWIRIPSGVTDPLSVPGPEITLEALAWRDFPTSRGWSGLVMRQLGTSSGDGFALAAVADSADRLAVAFGGQLDATTTCLPNRQWVYAVGTDTATQLALYADGARVATGPTLPMTLDGNDVTIGGSENGPTEAISELWKGGIDEVRISSVARSPAWIAAQQLCLTRAFVSFGTPETL